MGEKQKGHVETLRGKVSEISAKVAIINAAGAILTLRRSQKVNKRRGELDWPGGSSERTDADMLHTLHREVCEEELQGTELYDIRPLYRDDSPTEHGLKIAVLFVAAATFPEGGIVLSDEHQSYEWVDHEDYPGLVIPKKYRLAVDAGRTAIKELAEIQNDNYRPFLPEPVGAGLIE